MSCMTVEKRQGEQLVGLLGGINWMRILPAASQDALPVDPRWAHGTPSAPHVLPKHPPRGQRLLCPAEGGSKSELGQRARSSGRLALVFRPSRDHKCEP